MGILFSVIIPTFNRVDILKNTLDSVITQQYPSESYEVIVINDGSKDNTAKFLNDYSKNFKNFIFINQQNQGANYSRNIGIKKARGNIIAFIDDDCIADSKWLMEIASSFDNQTVGGVEGRTITDIDKVTPFTHQIINETGNNYYTCNIAYKKSILEITGGFDEKYPTHNDDLDLAAKIIHYKQIAFNPKAIVTHPPYPYSFKKHILKISNYYAEFRLYFKHPEFYKQYKGINPWWIMLYVIFKQPIIRFLQFKKYFKKNPFSVPKYLFLIVAQGLYFIFQFPFYFSYSFEVKYK